MRNRVASCNPVPSPRLINGSVADDAGVECVSLHCGVREEESGQNPDRTSGLHAGHFPIRRFICPDPVTMLLAQLSMRKRCASAPEQSLKPRSQLPGARPYMSYRANSRTDRVLSENLCVEGECHYLFTVRSGAFFTYLSNQRSIP